jgi:hypothetical protein
MAAVRKERMAARPAVAKAAAMPAKKAARGPKVKLPRMATPTGAIRGSDRAKVKADARKGIGTPYSRASQRAIDRSAREAPLQRKQAIAAAKRKGRTGFGKGPQMNAGSIGNRDFAWNKNETPATARERLAMWRKSEQRRRGNARLGSIGVKGAAGTLRASRRAAALVDSGNRLGNLPTTRRMAEQPRQRRNDRISRNETQGRLASSEASRRLLPQIQKVRDAAQKRITEGKKPTAAQKEKERKLVGGYNKAARKLQVAQAAKEYTSNPYGFKPQRMSGAVKPKPARPEAAVKTKPPAARKGKTVEQVRKQWDERIAPSFNRRKSAIEKMPQGVGRQNKLIALARRERNAGGALVRKLSELQSGTIKPVNNRPKSPLAVRVAKADKADRKLKAQLKQAIASGNEKKIIELNFRRRRIDRFSETYNFADLKASRKALTPTNPTAPKRTRSARPAGTVAKPRGMRPGVLAARRGVKAAPTAAQFSLLSARAKEKAARIRRRAGLRFTQANEQDRAAIKKATSTKTAGNRNKANKALRSAMVMQKAVRMLTGQITPSATRRPLATRFY